MLQSWMGLKIIFFSIPSTLRLILLQWSPLKGELVLWRNKMMVKLAWKSWWRDADGNIGSGVFLGHNCDPEEVSEAINKGLLSYL